ncbi:GDCCVxC domain-containing (seleno)protein [Sphingobium sp. HBC34]|uniref:GDCCVxC domain-containing (Seleno)protein n=1 Tax=Sphingobium cyanobacteriorum TaxID=3063954 RepID=A0ABT8ZRN8_9SPHN|nr:GDCCVxC domain-containing (seleno)protein [Sphingobium sp. HBC34]MDO7837212.1 GDCCVxC domain-containing (seleno)protein [Sphingobium sp. HBC34]
MPTDTCRFFYHCEGCGETLRPLEGDCCVFCSYGTSPMPTTPGRELLRLTNCAPQRILIHRPVRKWRCAARRTMIVPTMMT